MTSTPEGEHFFAGRFGGHFEFIRNPQVSTGNWPLVSPAVYAWTIGTIAVSTVLIGTIRTIVRLKINGRLDLHDALFAVALCCSALSAVFNVYCESYFYVQAEISMGSIRFAKKEDMVPAVVQTLQILNSVSAVAWIAIYSVKICYLIFFNKLTSRLRNLRIWWWFVLCFTIPCLITSCLMGLYLCADFGPNILLYCSISILNVRGGTWNRITGALDIATDLMIISIPIILISRVQIDFKRKIVIGTILSLSAAMIATALIRLFPPTMHILSIDGPWYFFWEAVESSLAVLMVSITSFKSIYGASNNQSSNSSRPSITPLSKVKDSINSRMSKIFVRNGKSDPSTMQSFEEFSSNPPAGRIQDGRYFELETPKEHTSDPEKGFGNHTNVVSQITVREQIDVELSERSASDLSSVSTKAFSPMSPKNPATSPSSTRLDPQSPESWNMGGKH